MSSQAMRGLEMFIKDIRNCKNKEAEQKRVDHELSHIREKFTQKGGIDGYDKKKYVWKLVYIYMLGYDVDVGHMEAMQLVAAQKYTEKSTGYLAISVLLNETDQILRLVIQATKNDLNSRNDIWQCLALACVANVGGQEFAESLASDVQNLLVAGTSRAFVRKKASLCLLRLFRKYPDCVPLDDVFLPKLYSLLDDPSLGVVNSLASLLLGLVSHNPEPLRELPERIVPVLHSMIFTRERFSDYKYYHTICPWLQVKFLRILQFFTMPKEGEMRKKLNDSLVFILTKTEVTKSVNKNNADHGILFEAINLVIHYSLLGTKDHLQKAAIMLGRFISVKEPNIRYLGLDTMARLTQVPDTQPMVRDHIKTVNFSLQDADISIRKRALDLLFNMCDTDNAEEIVGELLKYLHKADFNIKEELVVRIALLAERFAKDLRWYIDVVLQLITLAGDFVNEDIWFRVVQIVTNNDELQEYAATNVLKALQSPSIHESGVKVGGYILGEFGYQIKDESVTGASLLDVLLARFKASSTETKALLFTAFIKLANTFPELRPRVDEIFAQYLASADTELQQRAVEYHAMYVQKKEDVMQSVLEVMPSFPERESALMRRIKKLHRAVGGKVATAGADSEGKEAEEGGGGEEAAAAAHSDEEQTADKEASGDEADTAAATTKAAASAPPAKSANLFDDITDFGGGAKPAAAAGGDADADSVLPAQDAGALSASLGMPACTVYDSDPLQVNMQVKVAGNQMKMVLTFVSKGGAEVRVTHSAFADGDGAVKVQMKPIEFAVAPGGQVPQYLLWHCTAPFTSTPTINYTLTVDGAEASLDLKLPVDVTNFCAPAPLDAASFISTWRANEVQAVEAVKSSGQVDKEVLKERIASLMHLAVIDGVEKNEDNFSASAVFKNGAASVPAVLRVETKPGSAYVRLTARSSQRVLSDALLRTAKILIGATSF